MKHIPARDFQPDPQTGEVERRRSYRRLGLGALGLGLTAAALYNARRARKVEEARPETGRFVEVDGVRVHYVEQGQGSPVLLFHGNAVTLADWQRSGVMERTAARGHRVIAFDRPGFGATARPRDRIWTLEEQGALLMKAARALGVEAPVVVGHSIGASIALAAAMAAPEQVAGLVLLSGFYFWTVRADVAVTAPPAIPLIGDVLRYTVSPPLGRALWPKTAELMFGPGDVPEGFVEATIGETTRPSQIRAIAADSLVMGPSVAVLAKGYEGFRVPVVMIAGDADRIVDYERHSRRLCYILPNCVTRVFYGVGHMTLYADPEGVAAAVDEVVR